MLSSTEFQVIGLSLQVAALGTAIGLPIALWIGWLLAKSSMRGKALLDTLVSFPLVLPPGGDRIFPAGAHGPRRPHRAGP